MYLVKIKGLESVPFITDENGAEEIIKSFDLPKDSLKNGFSNDIISLAKSGNVLLEDFYKEKVKAACEKKIDEILTYHKETEDLKLKIDEKSFKEARRKYLEAKIIYEKESQELEILKNKISTYEKERKQNSIKELTALIDDKNTPLNLKAKAIGVLFADFGVRHKDYNNQAEWAGAVEKAKVLEREMIQEDEDRIFYEELRKLDEYNYDYGYGYQKKKYKNDDDWF
ncbi:MAG: hypothetical protein EKK64_04830 [Neisseriaceae bacterium]|nr:MAG: hypothetical protein EKK64_04830 [Neisseriaceae bacterium]